MKLLFLFVIFSLSAREYLPRIVIFDSPEELAEACSDRIAQLVTEKKNCVLGLATGNTPLLTYRSLAGKIRCSDLSGIVTFNLDEYAGLSSNDPHSFHFYMQKHLFCTLMASQENPLGLKQENLHLPDGMGEGEKRATEYENLLASLGPIDLQILGIGTNGHIGFAEPGSSFEGKTTLVHLSENTRKDNASSFEGQPVPEFALTMGISTILRAKEIFLLATGEKKAKIIQKMLSDPLSTNVPATALRLHPNVTLFLDRSAAALLEPAHAEN